MVDLQIPIPDAGRAACDLSERVRAASVGASTKASFAALAALAPADALDHLIRDAEPLVRDLPSGDLSASVLTAFRGVDATARATLAPRILRAAGARLTPAAVAEVSTAGTFAESEERAALDAALARAPADAGLLRAAVRVAQARHDAGLDALLTRLGNADPSPATVAFVHRARRPDAAASATATARIALVSSYTIDALVPYVDLACRTHGIVPRTYVAPFNSWTRDVIDPASGLRAFAPDVTFLAIAIDDLVPQLAGAPSAADLACAGDDALARVLAVVDGYVAWSAGRPLVVHAFHSAFAGPQGVLDGADGPSRAEWLSALDGRLRAAVRERPGCYVLDVADAVARAGATFGDNAKLRHIAAMRLPPGALASVAEAYVRYVAPACGLVRKCVVLDLDNTLWGGVVGEDGAAGIRLGATAPGSEFVEFQTFLQTLTERGILLAIASKNNAADALEVIRNHEAMVLRESAFSAMRIDWQPKPDNLRAIARELNIGLDALVFVDDNPDERERMRRLAPDVLTVELPTDPTQYRATLERLPQLQTLAITSEDRSRVAQYATARRRDAAKSETGDVEAYLRSLDLRVDIARATAAAVPRVAQLFAKTNQFNLTTRRYDAAAVLRFVEDPAMRLWTLASHDRFGAHGLVAVALVRTAEDAWTIDSFLMSCRVIGYGIETALLAHVASDARAAGARALIGEFVETPKNAPAKDLYARHGFAAASRVGEVERRTLALTDAVPFPAWIQRTT